MITLKEHQSSVLGDLKSGSILCGGTGSGKSITSIAYFIYFCEGVPKTGNTEWSDMKKPRDLYIITTAKKRDSADWELECAHFALSTDKDRSVQNVKVTIDSWNNIKKYIDVKDAFFIFDEQRLVGKGAWVKSFQKIAKKNSWILLTATPGDDWVDYIPVFVANGFYKNRAEFNRRHVVMNYFGKYPKIERYIETGRLFRLRNAITVHMPFERSTIQHHEKIPVPYDRQKFKAAIKERWNIFDEKPIKDITQLFVVIRRIVNSDPSRFTALREIIKAKKKVIVFYNFNYELDILRQLYEEFNVAEWNGHKHEAIPFGEEWVYLVQYNAGAEGWNCVTTDTIVFYSLNYSHKIMHQACGRIDRMNTPYTHLWYYYLMSSSPIDVAINKALIKKKNFHESSFTFD